MASPELVSITGATLGNNTLRWAVELHAIHRACAAQGKSAAIHPRFLLLRVWTGSSTLVRPVELLAVAAAVQLSSLISKEGR